MSEGVIGTFGFYFGGVDPAELGADTSPYGATPLGRVYTTRGGERLDQIAQEVYGEQLGIVEALLITNPGLADRGYTIEAGVAIFLPVLAASASQQPSSSSREVALWG